MCCAGDTCELSKADVSLCGSSISSCFPFPSGSPLYVLVLVLFRGDEGPNNGQTFCQQMLNVYCF